MPRDSGDVLYLKNVLGGNLIPLGNGASASTESQGHRDNTAELAGRFINNRITFGSHIATKFRPATPESQARLHLGDSRGAYGTFMGIEMGDRIRKARKGRMSQTALGQALPTVDTGLPTAEVLTKGAISQWEKGDTTPTLQAAAATALLLGRSLDHLVFGRSRTFEARIDALPQGFGDEVLKVVIDAIERAEDAARALTKAAANNHLGSQFRKKAPVVAKSVPSVRSSTQRRKRKPDQRNHGNTQDHSND